MTCPDESTRARPASICICNSAYWVWRSQSGTPVGWVAAIGRLLQPHTGRARPSLGRPLRGHQPTPGGAAMSRQPPGGRRSCLDSGMGLRYPLRLFVSKRSDGVLRTGAGLMRHVLAWALALAAGVGAGCLTTEAERRPTPRGAGAGLAGGSAKDETVQVQVAVIERPSGDPYLSGGVWELSDEQCVSLERRPALEANGFRVGQLGGILPAELQRLLSSPRSCPAPRRLLVPAGRPQPLLLGPPRAHCAFEVHQGGGTTRARLEQAQCALLLTATPVEQNRVRLRLVPAVRHGRPTAKPQAVRGPDGALRWEMEARQPEAAYPEMGWEL